jgi:hypothetical protein
MKLKPKPKLVRAADGTAIRCYQPDVRFDLGPEHPSLAIAKLIMERQGAEQAITIESIAKELWPTEWSLTVADSYGKPTYPYRLKLQRAIKQWIADLVNLEGKLIVSNRGARHPGYYVPVTREEVDQAARTYVRQAVQMLRRARRLTGNERYGELAGQLCLIANLRPEEKDSHAEDAAED